MKDELYVVSEGVFFAKKITETSGKCYWIRCPLGKSGRYGGLSPYIGTYI